MPHPSLFNDEPGLNAGWARATQSKMEHYYPAKLERSLFETGATAYRDDIMKELKIVLALRSVVYGTPADLAAYNDAMELITQPDRRLEFQRRWNEKRRGSSNDIGGRARALAESFESSHKPAGDPT